MIVSIDSFRVISRWLPAIVLLCEIIVLSAGVAHAQDVSVLKKNSGDAKTEPDKNSLEAANKRMAAFSANLKVAVAKGELTEEQGWTKWAAYKKDVVTPRLEAAVRSGEISEAVARAILQDIERGEAVDRIAMALAKGRISNEEANAKWAEIAKADDVKYEGGAPGAGLLGVAGHLQAMSGRIRAAAVAGKISEKDAWTKWLALKNKVITESVANGKITPLHAKLIRRESAKLEAAELRAAAAAAKSKPVGEAAKIEAFSRSQFERLKGAVAAGKIPEKEAWAQWDEIKQQTIIPRLKKAVRDGKMSDDDVRAFQLGIESAETAAKLDAINKKEKEKK